MDAKSLDNLKKLISETHEYVTKQLTSLGATKKTIDSFLEGEEFLTCPRCSTFNLHEVSYLQDNKGYYSIYECDKCSSLYRRNWKI